VRFFCYGDKGGHSEVLKFLKCHIVGPSIDINDVSLQRARLSAAEADGRERDEEEQEERVSGVELVGPPQYARYNSYSLGTTSFKQQSKRISSFLLEEYSLMILMIVLGLIVWILLLLEENYRIEGHGVLICNSSLAVLREYNGYGCNYLQRIINR